MSQAGTAARHVFSRRALRDLKFHKVFFSASSDGPSVRSALGNREIAKRLGISLKTVEAHKEHLKSKLAMQSARELRHFAST